MRERGEFVYEVDYKKSSRWVDVADVRMSSLHLLQYHSQRPCRPPFSGYERG